MQDRIVADGITFDDVLLLPGYSEIVPSEIDTTSRFSRRVGLKIPIVSAAMDTVTESRMAIAMAREGGIGIIHKNMSIERQAMKVRKVKRAESGMILDPVTLPADALVRDAKASMKEHSIGGIPIVEHLCHLDALPDGGFKFFAVPPPVKGMGSFPVRAFAVTK